MKAAWAQTHSYVGIIGFSALQIVLIEEGCELGLDAAQRLRITMQQQNHVHHWETLTNQRQQISKEPYQTNTDSGSQIEALCWTSSCATETQKPLPTASPAPGVKRLLVWESLWINWAMLSVLPWPAPREPIMVDRTPCTMPVKSSGLRVSPPPLGGWGAVVGVAAEGAGGVACEGGGCWFGGGNTGWPDWKENRPFKWTHLVKIRLQRHREKHSWLIDTDFFLWLMPIS